MTGGATITHVNDIAFVGSTLVAGLRRRGIDARLVDPPKPAGRWPGPAKAFAAPLRLAIMAAVARELRQSGLVHVHYATHGLIGRRSGRPYVLHCHGSDVRDVRQGSFIDRDLVRSMAGAGLVLYSTPDLRPAVSRYRDDAVFLPNPIDAETFAPGGSAGSDLLLATRLDPIKGADTALDVVDAVLRMRPSTSVTIVAEGAMAGEAARRFDGRARLVTGRPHAEMPALYRAHRVAIGQFRLGILSQVELEAMACGAAVAVALKPWDSPGAAPPTINEAQVRPAAEAIVALLEDPERLEALAASGRRWVVERHGLPIVVDRLVGLYRDAFAMGEGS